MFCEFRTIKQRKTVLWYTWAFPSLEKSGMLTLMKQHGGTPWGFTYGLGLFWGLSVLGWSPAAATAIPAQPGPTNFLTTPLSFEVPIDDTNNTSVVGTTASSDFPRTAPLQALPSGGLVVAQSSETETQGADLTLTMEDNPDPVERGKPLTYTLTVTNNGPEPATGVEVRNTGSARLRVESVLPSQGTGCLNEEEDHVCQLGTLTNGDEAIITITGTPLAAPFILTNQASVQSDSPDPDFSNNSTNNDTAVTAPKESPVADLSLIKTDETEQPTLGAPVPVHPNDLQRGPGYGPQRDFDGNG